MRFATFATILVALAPAGASAQPLPEVETPAGMRACALGAWVEDDDPAGVNVRAAPSADAPVIAALPAAQSPEIEGGRFFGAELDIVGVLDGWFLIENAEHPEALYGPDENNPSDDLGIYAGRGWVHGSRLAVEIQSGEALRAAADPASGPVFELPEPGGELHVSVEGFLDCDGDAARLAVRTSDGIAGEGWIGGIERQVLCANQATTCS